MKNLALLGGRPLMSYAIEAAKTSKVFDRVVVNADHPIFQEIAAQAGVEFYLRPPDLGSSETKSDGVVYDFMLKHPADIVAWVNPTSPFQTGEEIRAVVTHFQVHGLDSLITVKEERLHGLQDGQPLNFDVDTPFARTQDLAPIQLFVYSVMMWRTRTFLDAFAARGYALLSGKVGYFPVSKFSSLLIKTPEDLQIAEAVLRANERGRGEIPYDPRAQRLLR
jgi:CMP-N-acetylneuraminic acid synthetase